jgi:hypothetical protein
MPQLLKESEKTLNRFIKEAQSCAQKQMGFAALCTVFPVILTISEAVVLNDNKDAKRDVESLMFAFATRMNNQDWLIRSNKSQSSLSDRDLAQLLCEVRHGLAHQASLPLKVGLANNVKQAPLLLSEKSNLEYALCVREFVREVARTAKSVRKSHPEAIIDPKPPTKVQNRPRSTAERVIVKRRRGPTVSASSPS